MSFKLFKHNSIKSVQSKAIRNFFAYFRIAFNSVDEDRLKSVGPDRLCAEWLIKNGGIVRYKGHSVPIEDYNHLPNNYQKLYLAEADATDSSIMAIGFDHFKVK